MKIKRELIPSKNFVDFAEENKFTLIITERGRQSRTAGWIGLPRFYARFDHVDVKEGSMLSGSCGNGDTEEKAIADYANEISEKLLVFKAMYKSRREVKAPRLIFDGFTVNHQAINYKP